MPKVKSIKIIKMILTKIFLQNLVNQETSKFSQLMFEGVSTLFFAIKWYFYLNFKLAGGYLKLYFPFK
jgi:hypothetical protein